MSGWGKSLWATSIYAARRLYPGDTGVIPLCPPYFDIACFHESTHLQRLLTYPGLSLFALDPYQFIFLSSVSCAELRYEPPGNTHPVVLHADLGVTENWSFETTIRFESLPSDFSDVVHYHACISVINEQGICGTLFFSEEGVGYSGAVAFAPGTGEISIHDFSQVPQSDGVVEPGVFYTLRVVGEKSSRLVFVYITPTDIMSLRGHQLRFVLPAHIATDAPFLVQDGVFVSCAGTTESVQVWLQTFKLSSKVLVPNVLPIADPGKDLFVRSCAVAKLSAEKSFDLEGFPLSYFWRMIDGPPESVYVGEFDDGVTGTDTPFTGILYSDQLRERYLTEGFKVGDVITSKEGSFAITAIHPDPVFYVELERAELAPSMTNKTFRLVTQNSLMQPTDKEPSFFADCSGAFRFELKVFDGRNESLPAYLTVVSTDAAVDRGVTPDVSFIWDYLSNFWQLVEGTEHIETFWGASTQVAASEMLTAWQHEYSKSLSNIQSTFKRRWLHYDPLLQEPIQEQSSVHTLLSGVDSELIVAGGVSCGAYAILTVGGEQYQLNFPQQSTYTASQLKTHLEAAFRNEGLTDFSVELIESPAIGMFLRVLSPRVFSIQCLNLFDGTSSIIQGTLGDTFNGGFSTGVSLQGLGIQEDDWLIFDEKTYRIRVVLEGHIVGDDWSCQRVLVKDEIFVGSQGPWKIVRPSKSSGDVYQECVSEGDVIQIEVYDPDENKAQTVSEAVLAVHPDMPKMVAHTVGALGGFVGVEKFVCRILSILRKTHVRVPKDVLHIPYLADRVNDVPDDEVLRENIDFFLEDFRSGRCIRFDQRVWGGGPPKPRLWAEVSYLDNRPTISNNFGEAVGLPLERFKGIRKDVDYLSAVRGIWFAHMHGPTMRNLRVGIQILLGLPFSPAKGKILQLQAEFLDMQGRLLFQEEDGHITSFLFPKQLGMETNPRTGEPFKEGDEVEAFYPLVRGVEILDYIADTTWMKGRIDQGVFQEAEKFFKFLVRMDRRAFSLPSLALIREFVLRIKPTYTYPIFSILVEGAEGTSEIDVRDQVLQLVRLKLENDLLFSGYGAALKLDDQRPAYGGIKSRWDEHSLMYPEKTEWSGWGIDKSYMHPNDVVFIEKQAEVLETDYPRLDSLFTLDMPFVPDRCRYCFSPLIGYADNTDITIPLDTTHKWMFSGISGLSGNTTGVCIQLRTNAIAHNFPEKNFTAVFYQDASALLGTWQFSLGLAPFAFKADLSVSFPSQGTHRTYIGHDGAGLPIPWTSGVIWESHEMRMWRLDTQLGVDRVAVMRVI